MLGAFSADVDSADFMVELVPRLEPELAAQLPPSRGGVSWKEISQGEWGFKIQSLAGHVSIDKKVMTLSTTVADVYESAPTPGFLLSRLRLLVILNVTRQGGIAVHSSAVGHNDRALAFYGPSERGKSTIARLLSNTWRTLSDETNVILPEADRLRLYSTPFCRIEDIPRCSNGSGVLAGLFQIEQDERNVARPLTSREAYLGLIGSAFFLPNRDKADALMENCEKILNRVPAHCLRFSNAVLDQVDLVNVLSRFME